MVRGLLIGTGMTVLLDVIAVCRVPEDEPPPPAPDVPSPPKTMPAPSGVFLIHVAPSPRLDPSKPENVTIVDDGDLPAHQRTFVITEDD